MVNLVENKEDNINIHGKELREELKEVNINMVEHSELKEHKEDNSNREEHSEVKLLKDNSNMEVLKEELLELKEVLLELKELKEVLLVLKEVLLVLKEALSEDRLHREDNTITNGMEQLKEILMETSKDSYQMNLVPLIIALKNKQEHLLPASMLKFNNLQPPLETPLLRLQAQYSQQQLQLM